MILTQSINFVMKMLTRQKIIDDEACSSIKQCETSDYIQEHKFESIPNFGKVVAIAQCFTSFQSLWLVLTLQNFQPVTLFMTQLMFQKLKLML